MSRDGAITPMTLGNMRANGVRSLIVYCTTCPRTTVFNVDTYPDALPVPAFGPRMVCTGCGMIGATRARIGPGIARPERGVDAGLFAASFCKKETFR